MDYDEIGAMLGHVPVMSASGRREGSSLRERFRQTMAFEKAEVIPNFEFGYWARTLKVWHEQGLPEFVVDEASAYDYFGIEPWAMLNVTSNPLPLFERTVFEETDENETYRDELGCIARINKHGDQSIPHFLEYPVKDRASWKPYKAALDPDDPRRWEQFDASLEVLSERDAPIGVYGGSMAGVPRNLIGFERIATMAYEDPQFLTEIVDAFGACAVAVVKRVLSRVKVDFCMGWEDICFNMGPIIPPAFFKSVVGPWFRRISDLLIANGCHVYTTDTDGNILLLVETFLDNGLNTMFPVEVHAGSDPCLLRGIYGTRIRLWGGFCKRKLAHSREAIDAELERLRPYVEQGGFIPGLDHRVPADVSLDLYKYYLDRKRAVLRVGGEPKY
jgi:uroporphyrinogen decarboxylase